MMIVVDRETNKPVFGVTIIVGGVSVTFSDEEGRFTLLMDKIQSQDAILFSHISYNNQSVTASQLQIDSIVRIESRSISLAEVKVMPVNQKKLIPDIVAQYRKTAPTQPYWTKVHQTQTLIFRGEPAGYVEYTGHMLYIGRDITDAFIFNAWIPEHIRRTKENTLLSLISEDEYRTRISEHSISSVLTNYRFFDVVHPFGKFHNRFTLSIDSSFTADGIDY